jgi:DNA topoisomerase-1
MPDTALNTAPDPRLDAQSAGLIYSTDEMPGISRIRCGRGWSFKDPSGCTISDRTERQRCLSIGVPPAYENVWICPDAKGHLQATGRDGRGRKTYLYHTDWRRFRDEKKFASLPAFGNALREARRVNDGLRRGQEPSRARVLASVFHLLDTHAVRVGNDTYAQANGSYGATTLRRNHLQEAEDHHLVLKFKGKSGKMQEIALHDRRFENLLRTLSDLPGQRLFQYEDEEGALCPLTSSDVNAYLHGLFGSTVTAKTFRTWHGSVAAFEAACERGAKVDDVLTAASAKLGNTKAIARTSYVHPRIVEEVKDGTFGTLERNPCKMNARKGLSGQESAFLRWLDQ